MRVTAPDSSPYLDNPVLRGDLVVLEPLGRRHADDLAEAVAVGDLWRTWYTHIPAPDAMAGEIEERLARHTSGSMVPWAVVRADTGRAVGMTTYLSPDAANRRVEIGATWLGRAVQRTGVNAEAKLLLLTRAFEELGCNAVEFRTHWHNQQSRAAIARLGAKQDGVLRNHIVWEDGSLRDTVVFSVIATEWPAVRRGLTERLAATRPDGRAEGIR